MTRAGLAPSGVLGRLAARYRAPLVLGLSCFGLLLLGWLLFVVGAKQGTVGFDSFAYWSVDPHHPYNAPLGTAASFTYSPVVAIAFAPAHLIRFPYFYLLWAGFLLGCLVWLCRRYTLLWLAFLPVPLELYHANVHLLLAGVCVLGFRYPALWSIGLLTKVTPGIGLLWYVARREWRPLAIALGVTAALSLASFAVAPDAWPEWIRFLTSSTSGPVANGQYLWVVPPLPLRLLAAGALVVWGARTDRRWVMPVAMTIALPVLWITGPAILTAIPRLRARPAREASVPGESGLCEAPTGVPLDQPAMEPTA